MGNWRDTERAVRDCVGLARNEDERRGNVRPDDGTFEHCLPGRQRRARGRIQTHPLPEQRNLRTSMAGSGLRFARAISGSAGCLTNRRLRFSAAFPGVARRNFAAFLEISNRAGHVEWPSGKNSKHANLFGLPVSIAYQTQTRTVAYITKPPAISRPRYRPDGYSRPPMSFARLARSSRP